LDLSNNTEERISPKQRLTSSPHIEQNKISIITDIEVMTAYEDINFCKYINSSTPPDATASK